MSINLKLIDDAVNEFSKLPGIGRRTAMRFVLYLLKKELNEVERFANTIVELRRNIRYCKICHNISEMEVCDICSNRNRDNSLICVVEDIRDVIAIENTMQYKGLYHILGGIISPLQNIGPNDLNINTLLNRVNDGGVKEVILALRTTIEGDTTNHYIYRKLMSLNKKDIIITMIARGVAVGEDLEYTDEITLGLSISNRFPFENIISK